MYYICITIEQNIRKMSKIKYKSLKQNSPDLDEFYTRERLFHIQNMDRDIRERDTYFIIKIISKGIAIFFTICFGFIAIFNYVNNIPIPTEIKIGVPLSAGFISDIPNTLLSIFKKSP